MNQLIEENPFSKRMSGRTKLRKGTIVWTDVDYDARLEGHSAAATQALRDHDDPPPRPDNGEDSSSTISSTALVPDVTPPSSSSGSEFECNDDIAKKGLTLHDDAMTASPSSGP